MSEQKQKIVRDLDDTGLKMRSAYSDWVKAILTILTGLLGLLVVLHDNPNPTLWEQWLFRSTLCLLGLSILFGGIQLFALVNFYQNLVGVHFRLLQQHNAGEKLPELEVVSADKFFVLTQRAFYVVLVLSLVSLIAYGIAIS